MLTRTFQPLATIFAVSFFAALTSGDCLAQHHFTSNDNRAGNGFPPGKIGFTLADVSDARDLIISRVALPPFSLWGHATA